MTINLQSGSTVPTSSLVVLAWRNLWRNPKRTSIMLAAITVGVWAMIFMTALMRGMVGDMLQRGIDGLPGHVQIHHPEYLDDPSVVNSIDAPHGKLLAAMDSPLVTKWFSRVKVPAVVASEQGSRGVLLLGIDPVLEQETLLSTAEISDGRFLESSSDTGLILGENLARRLETRVGKRVVLMSQDPDNEVVEMGVRVVGIYQAELSAQEDAYAYIGRTVLQEKLGIAGRVSEIAVFGEEMRNVEPVLAHINSNAPENFEVKAWNEVDGYLGSMLNVMDGFVLVWIIVLFLALSFGLANTLVMAVFERVREIGLMLALGMRPALVLWQILIESAFLLLVGLALGNLLSLLTIWSIADGIDVSGVAKGMEMAGAGSTLYPVLLSKDMIMANVVVLGLGLVTSFMPAWRASHYDPIRALNKPT